jgi:hypothetical protein
MGQLIPIIILIIILGAALLKFQFTDGLVNGFANARAATVTESTGCTANSTRRL